MFRHRLLRASSALVLAALVASGCAPVPHGADPGASRAAAAWATGPALPVEVVEITRDSIGRVLTADPAAAPVGPYRLGVGDVVHLHVVDEPELTLPQGYTVEPDGAIAVPYLGRVPAAEGSAEDLRAELARRLARYRAAPEVFVRITGFHARHVTVVGAVRQPSRQPLTDRPLSVIDAINAAGGFLDPANPPQVTLLRAGAELAVDLDGFLTRGTPLPVLADGDVVRAAPPTGPLARAPRARVALHAGGRMRSLDLAPGATLAGLATRIGAGAADTLYLLRPQDGRVLALAFAGPDATDPALGGRVAVNPGEALALLPGRATSVDHHLARLGPALAGLAGH